LIFSKEEIFLYINAQHCSFGDFFFQYITYIGDGVFVILFTLILLGFSYRHSLLSFAIYIISSQLVQFLKRVVFSDVPRPSKYFEGKATLHFVDGVTLNQMMSFPSGHTTSVFAFMAFLSIITKNKYFSMLYLLIACVVSFSRIYLSQHFLEDTMAGSIIGVLSAFMITYLFEKSTWFNASKLDGSLIKKK
jgi:membrane-associated phospholipid phosphatase